MEARRGAGLLSEDVGEAGYEHGLMKERPRWTSTLIDLAGAN
jgi:hypothetical protein